MNVDLGTIATIVSMLAGFVAVAAYLRHEIHELRRELKSDINRLDDRVYALAVGLNPRIEQRNASEA